MISLRIDATKMISVSRLSALIWSVLIAGIVYADEPRFHIYRTVEGDTLTKLAKRFLVNQNAWQIFLKENAIAHPDRIPVGTSIRVPVGVMRTEPAPAVVTVTKGKVESSARGVVAGQVVAEGDTLSTGDDGFVTLKLADGSTITVQSKSTVRLESARTYANTGGVSDAVVRLESGRLETRAAPQKGPAARFEIRTPTSNMGVRGTIFRVAADDAGKKGQSEVTEGLVGVTSQSSSGAGVRLDAGFGTIVEAGKPPLAPVALLPAPDLGSLPSVFLAPDMSVSFPPVGFAVAYRAQVANDAAFTSLIADVSTKLPAVTVKDLPDGDLFLRARAIDMLGLEGRDAVHAFRIRTRPPAPAIRQPADKARLVSDRVSFSWAPVPDAASYHLQVAEQPGFEKITAEKQSLTLPSVTFDTPFKSGHYQWRVASVTARGESGPWSTAQSFEVRALAPLLKARRGQRNMVLELAGAAGAQFQVQVSRDERFTQIVQDRTVSGPKVELSNLSVNVYYVRLRSVSVDPVGGPANTGAWSDTGRLEVYPNDWWLSTSQDPAR